MLQITPLFTSIVILCAMAVADVYMGRSTSGTLLACKPGMDRETKREPYEWQCW